MTQSRVIYVRLPTHHMKMSSTGIDNEKDWLSALQTGREKPPEERKRDNRVYGGE